MNNPDRYKIFQHSKPEELINIDLTNSIVIIDEAHKFIEKLNSDDLHLSIACSKLYVNIRNSYKRLLLTGTPLYNDFIDISYQINLLSDKDILPFNQAGFRKQYTTIQATKSFVRGHILESKLIGPLSISLTGMCLTIEPIRQMITMLVDPLFYLIRINYPIIDNYHFRDLNLYRLRSITEKYITYYNFQQAELTDYPAKNIHYMDVAYNDFQLNIMTLC